MANISEIELDNVKLDAKEYGVGYLVKGIRAEPGDVKIFTHLQEDTLEAAESRIARAIVKLESYKKALLPHDHEFFTRRDQLNEVISLLRGHS